MFADQSRAVGRRAARRLDRRRQRGSIAVLAAVWVLVAIVVLGAIDVGSLYFQKRDVQRLADMAALAAVQSMTSDPNGCLSDAKNGVTTSANFNDKGYSFTLIAATDKANPTSGNDQIAVSCGQWDPSTAYVTPAPAAANAAQVTVYRQVNYFFLGLLNRLTGRQAVVSATATARASAIDTFSVGATLANLNTSTSGVLDPLLTGLLGASANVNVGLVGYQSLAGVNVTLGQLASAAAQLGTPGMSTPASIGQLLGLHLSVADILKLAATAVGSNSTVSTVLTALSGKVGTNVNANKISLGSLLQYSGSNAEAAANASINVLQLLLTTAEVGAYNSALLLSVDQSTCSGTGPSSPLCPLIAAVASLVHVKSFQLQVLAPPSIGIGEAGQVNGVWRTQASQAEIGLYVDLQVLSDPPPLGIPGILTIQLSGPHLPLYLILGGPARAWLASTNCQSNPASSTVTFGALPGVAMLCAGNQTVGSLNLNSPSCSSATGTISVAKASGTLLGIWGGSSFSLAAVSLSLPNPVLSIGSSVPSYSGPPLPSTPGSLSATGQQLTLPNGPYTNNSQYSFCNIKPSNATCNLAGWSYGPTWTTSATATNSLDVQLNGLLQGIGGAKISIAGLTLSLDTLGQIASVLTESLMKLVDPLVNKLVTPLLTALGLQIGQLTVIQHSLTCNAPQIVH
ncbi:pilus assembly protein TadG-related protein [Burkholderia multivorans]|uniref:pilus assembly protein TadG-related protein n=1 Tax=Burkholderia multivorans TaxID=87883 RepID=UPI00264C8ADA|nr:pilus assembly protein TadG-related protein [Burkholderia multivorans]